MRKNFVLMERKKSEGALSAIYRLSAVVEGERVKEYRVSVALGEESSEVRVENLGGAVKLFSLASEGFVTPCTLGDVFEDSVAFGKI